MTSTAIEGTFLSAMDTAFSGESKAPVCIYDASASTAAVPRVIDALYGEPCVLNDLYYRALVHPNLMALYTQEGDVLRMPMAPASICKRIDWTLLSPLPRMLAFNTQDWIDAEREKAPKKNLAKEPQAPIGYINVATSLDTYTLNENRGMAAGAYGRPEGGAVFSVVDLNLLCMPPPRTVVDPVTGDRVWSCAAVARHEGHSVRQHDCVKCGRVARAAADTTACTRVPVSSDCITKEIAYAFLKSKCIKFWLDVRRARFYDPLTDSYVVAFRPDAVSVDIEAVYVFLAASLGFQLRKPRAAEVEKSIAAAAERRRQQQQQQQQAPSAAAAAADANKSDTGSRKRRGAPVQQQPQPQPQRQQAQKKATSRRGKRASGGTDGDAGGDGNANGDERDEDEDDDDDGEGDEEEQADEIARRVMPEDAIDSAASALRRAVDGTVSVDPVTLDVAAAKFLSPRAFVAFVAERLRLSAWAPDSVDHPMHEILRGRPWICPKFPARALAPGHLYQTTGAFESRRKWRATARQSFMFFQKCGWMRCGVDEAIQRLMYDLGSERRKRGTGCRLAGNFQQRGAYSRIDTRAYAYAEHLYERTTRPLLTFGRAVAAGVGGAVAPVPPSDAQPRFATLAIAATAIQAALRVYYVVTKDRPLTSASETPAGVAVRTAAQRAPRRKQRAEARAAARRATAQLERARRRTEAFLYVDDDGNDFSEDDDDDSDAGADAVLDDSGATAAADGASTESSPKRWRASSGRAMVPTVADAERREQQARVAAAEAAVLVNQQRLREINARVDEMRAPRRRPRWDAIAFTRMAWSRLAQGTEWVVVPALSYPRDASDTVADMLRSGAHHPLSQSPVRLCNAWIAAGAFARPANVHSVEAQQLDGALVDEFPGATGDAAAGAAAGAPPLPDQFARAHTVLWDAVERERARTDAALGADANFLGGAADASAAAWVFQTGLRAGLSLGTLWYLLLWYTWVDAVDPLWRSLCAVGRPTQLQLQPQQSQPLQPQQQQQPPPPRVEGSTVILDPTLAMRGRGGGGGYADDDDDDNDVRVAMRAFRVSSASAPARRGGAAADATAVSVDSDVTLAAPAACSVTLPVSARTREAGFFPAGIGRVPPALATCFGRSPSVVAALLRRLADEWDAGFVRVGGAKGAPASSTPLLRPDAAPTHTVTQKRLECFLGALSGGGVSCGDGDGGDGSSADVLQTLAAALEAGPMAPDAFPIHASRQYGAEMEALVRALVERYVVRPGVVGRILERRGGALLYRGARVESAHAVAARVAGTDWPSRQRATIAEAAISAANHTAAFGALMARFLCCCGQDDPRAFADDRVLEFAAHAARSAAVPRRTAVPVVNMAIAAAMEATPLHTPADQTAMRVAVAAAAAANTYLSKSTQRGRATAPALASASAAVAALATAAASSAPTAAAVAAAVAETEVTATVVAHEADVAAREAAAAAAAAAATAASHAGADKDDDDTAAAGVFARKRALAFLGDYSVHVAGAALPIARVAHWFVEGVVQPLTRLVLMALFPPGAAAPPEPTTSERAVYVPTAADGALVQTQRLWWGPDVFETMDMASLRHAGSDMARLAERVLPRLSVDPRADPQGARALLEGLLRGEDAYARIATLVAALAPLPAHEQLQLTAADGGSGRRSARAGSTPGTQAAAAALRNAWAHAFAAALRSAGLGATLGCGDGGGGGNRIGDGSVQPSQPGALVSTATTTAAAATTATAGGSGGVSGGGGGLRRMTDAAHPLTDLAMVPAADRTYDLRIASDHDAISWVRWEASQEAHATGPVHPRLRALRALLTAIGYTEYGWVQPDAAAVRRALAECAAALGDDDGCASTSVPIWSQLVGDAGRATAASLRAAGGRAAPFILPGHNNGSGGCGGGVVGAATSATSATAAAAAVTGGTAAVHTVLQAMPAVADALAFDTNTPAGWRRHYETAKGIRDVFVAVHDAGISAAARAALVAAVCERAMVTSYVPQAAAVAPAAALAAVEELRRAQAAYDAAAAASTAASMRTNAIRAAHTSHERVVADDLQRARAAVDALRPRACLRYPRRTDGLDRRALTLALVMFIEDRALDAAGPHGSGFTVEYGTRDAAWMASVRPSLLPPPPPRQMRQQQQQPSSSSLSSSLYPMLGDYGGDGNWMEVARARTEALRTLDGVISNVTAVAAPLGASAGAASGFEPFGITSSMPADMVAELFMREMDDSAASAPAAVVTPTPEKHHSTFPPQQQQQQPQPLAYGSDDVDGDWMLM